MRVGWLIVAIRMGLFLLPFRVLVRLVDLIGGAVGRPPDPRFDAELTVWAVEAVGRRLLGRNPCLTQALAVDYLFRRAGVPADLHIGVARQENGELKAHAWVESEGEVVIGGNEPLSEYTRLPSLEARHLQL